MVILGVLIGITYPTYLGYKDRANRSTAQANLREAIPAVEAFYHENQTYDPAVMTIAAIRSYDMGLSSRLRDRLGQCNDVLRQVDPRWAGLLQGRPRLEHQHDALHVAAS